MFSLNPFLRCCAITHFCCQLLSGFSSPSVHPHNVFNAPLHLITLCPASQPPAPSRASLPQGLLTPSSKLGSLQDSLRTWQVFLSYPVPKWPSWAHLLEGPRLLLSLTLSFVLRYSICSSTCPFHRAQNPPWATSTFRTQLSEGCSQPASPSGTPETNHKPAFTLFSSSGFPKASLTGSQLLAALCSGQLQSYRREQRQPNHCFWEAYNKMRNAVFMSV